MRTMMMKERNNKIKNLSHQDQDKLRGFQEEVAAQQLEEPDQQEEEELYGTQGIMQDGVHDQGTMLPGAKHGDLDLMGEATLQGKERRRRRTLGWR